MAQWKGYIRKTDVLVAEALLASCLACLAGCTARPVQSPDEQLRQEAAEQARQTHRDLQNVGKDTRQALQTARRETKDIVAGVKQGWKEGDAKPGASLGESAGLLQGGRIDVNHASVEKLKTLPGIHASVARRIVAGRPYRDTDELQRQGIVTEAEYSRINSKITAK